MSSKLLKSELKEIVKECLVEILSEGIGNKEVIRENRAVPVESNINRRTSFDHVEWQSNNSDREEIDYVEEASKLVSDPILAEVLADSHKTMNEQIAAESRGISASAGDFASRAAASSNPIDMFSESAANWAALAFDDKS